MGHFFSIINNIDVFFCESNQRMNIWEKESKDSRHRRFAPFGEIRWWAKDRNPDECLYVDVLLTLSTTQDQKNINTTAQVKAQGYIEGLLKYETILTAQVFLSIFHATSPV